MFFATSGVAEAQNTPQKITARFTETRTNTLLAQPEVCEGAFEYADGDITLRYAKPKAETLRISGNRITFTGEDGQERVLPYGAQMVALRNIFRASVTRDFAPLEDDCKVTRSENEDDLTVEAEVTAKRLKRHIKKLALTYGNVSGGLDRLVITDTKGNTKTFVFKEIDTRR